MKEKGIVRGHAPVGVSRYVNVTTVGSTRIKYGTK